MKKCIVTFANNEERYIKGLERQKQSIKAVNFDGDHLAFTTYEEIGSPSHEDVPYAFKAYAIKKAIELGYDLILWVDSPVYAIKPLDKIFDHIEKEGYLLFDNIGFTIGDFTSDKCLDLMGMTRDEAFSKQMIMACVMGLNVKKTFPLYAFFNYLELAKDQGHYEGDWNNNNLQVSSDPRVKGHRHDQSVMSILAAQHELKLTHPHSTYFAYFNHPGHLPHGADV